MEDGEVVVCYEQQQKMSLASFNLVRGFHEVQVAGQRNGYLAAGPIGSDK